MNLQSVLAKVNNIQKGSFVHVKFQSELPVRAASKRAGVQIWKVTEMCVRLGIDYSNIKSVIQRRAEEGKPDYECPYTYINDYVVQSKKDPSKYYLNMFFAPKPGTVTKFYKDGKEVSINDYRDDIQPSYFKPSEGPKAEMFRVKIENILEIRK